MNESSRPALSCPGGLRFSWKGNLEQGSASVIVYHLCKHACKDNNKDVINARKDQEHGAVDATGVTAQDIVEFTRWVMHVVEASALWKLVCPAWRLLSHSLQEVSIWSSLPCQRDTFLWSVTLQPKCTVITACFVCEIIVTFSSGDDEVGAVSDNNTNRKQQEDGANEGDAPLFPEKINWRG